jgi:tetratricopeptide (TPR) repeat protein
VAAREGFLAAGDIVGAARAEILLSWLTFHTGRGKPGRDHSQHAVELLSGLPPSPLHAVAHARLGRRFALAGEPERALAEARRALALAEEFGDDRTASDALNTIGLARGDLGETEGLDDLREAVRRAERANAPHEGATAWNNLTNQLWKFGRLAEAAESWQAGYDLCVRYGYTAAVRWAETEAALNDFARGYLQSAEARARAILSTTERGFYMESAMRSFTSAALALRGAREEALSETKRSLEHARPIGDPQMIWPMLASAAAVHWLLGDGDETMRLLGELTAGSDYVAYEPWTTYVPLVLFETGGEKLYADAVAAKGRLTPWTEAGLALTGHDPARAAELYGAMGARFFEAWATLLAAERGDTRRLADARAYFVEEEMTVFLRRCDALLQASA